MLYRSPLTNTYRNWLTVSIASLLLLLSLCLMLPAPVMADISDKEATETLTRFGDAMAKVAERVTPAVVNISTTRTVKAPRNPFADDPFFKRFFGDIPQGEQKRKAMSLGSGFIAKSDGYIITNNHVVQEADHDGIKVTLLDKRTFDAKLIGRDPTTDVAVIKITGSNLPTASLGNSDSTHVGEWVVAVGNPLGLDYTVTQGIISALGRNINIIQNQYRIEDFIQTDAVINPGNSGGPLVDLRGQVVGINTAIATNTGTYEGYGFAIPINIAEEVAKDLIDHGKVIRPYIGVAIKDIDQTFAKALGMKDAEGVLVQSVEDNSPAESADIKPGDVILKFDGQKVDQANQLQALVASRRPGEKVDIQLLRDGKTTDVTVTLKERENEEFASNSASESSSSEKLESLGLSVQDADKATLAKYDAKEGIIVTDVISGSEADQRGLQRGDLITSVDNKPIKSTSEFEKSVDDHKPGDALLVRVTTSNKAKAYLALEIPEK